MLSPTSSPVHDVIVVGARAAGAATALLLARLGHDVVVVDRTELPSDTISTHQLARTGVLALQRWGLFDEVVASGAPVIRQVTFRTIGDPGDPPSPPVTREIKDKSGVDCLMAPRRWVLDTLVARAAERAGATIRYGVTINGVLRDDSGRVVGVRGHDERDQPVQLRARFVVGADGLGSRVARSVGAERIADRGAPGAALYAYYAGLPWPGIEFVTRTGSFAGVFPTHHGEAAIWVCLPTATALAARKGRSADAAFAAAEHVSTCDLLYPRVHPAPLETCGIVAALDPVTDRLVVHCTTQAPHAHRTLYATLTGIPEHRIRIVAPDIGGGFGNKVALYPGYLCAVYAATITGAPVKWTEDRSENLMSTSFARDYHMHGEIAATKDGRITGLRVRVLADHGAFNGTSQPSKFPAGFFHIFTGSYAIQAAHCRVTGVYTNKAPGGVAYACSFRITEASYLVERMVDVLAFDLGLDPAQVRRKNLLRPEQFPYRCATGWVYDSGDYPRALEQALEMAEYAELRAEQAQRRAEYERTGEGALLGIGLSTFTEAVGAGPKKQMDIGGLGMADAAELSVHPDGTAELRLSCMSQGQGHETTFAQIIAHELGISPYAVNVVQGDTDRTPFGLGTYGSRSTPVSGAAAATAAGKASGPAMSASGSSASRRSAPIFTSSMKIVALPSRGTRA